MGHARDPFAAPPHRSGPRRGLLRRALAVGELSLALVLLIGAGLLVKSFYHVLSVDPGFAPERVLTLSLSLTGHRMLHGIRQRHVLDLDSLGAEFPHGPSVLVDDCLETRR